MTSRTCSSRHEIVAVGARSELAWVRALARVGRLGPLNFWANRLANAALETTVRVTKFWGSGGRPSPDSECGRFWSALFLFHISVSTASNVNSMMT